MKLRFLPLIASVPLAGYLIVLCFAFVAMLKIGHWPYYSHPDPKDLNMPIWLGASSIGFLASVAGGILIPGILCFVSLMKREKHREKDRKNLILPLSLYALGMLLWIVDFTMGTFSYWILD